MILVVGATCLTNVLISAVYTSGLDAQNPARAIELALFCTCEILASLLAVGWILRPIGDAARAMRLLTAKLAQPTAPVAGELAGLLADIRQVSAHFAQSEATSDRIEGPPAREAFLAELNGQIGRNPSPALLAVVRLGNFDRIAAFDRSAAELALAQFGERFRAAVRRTARLFQVEHDCFALWLPSNGGEDPTAELRAIAYVLSQDIILSDKTITPEVRLGCAFYPRDGEDVATLFACALAALPKTNTSDATLVNVFTPLAAEAARRIFLIQQGLRQAIAEDQLLLAYQPVVDLRQKRVIGAEALLRWAHPELGVVPPSEFVPVLEQSGFIDEVGSWVLNAACRELRSWRRRGLNDLTMAVNVSARQFRGSTLAMTVVRTLERNGLTPADLEIELTETAAMEDAARTREILQQLHALGVGVAIDDFGVGFSSLSYLKNLPFSKLKIDREFVVDVHQRPDSRAICSSLIALARGLDIKLLAEGVERLEEVEALLALGCSTFQGYFFAMPLAADEFARTITDVDWLKRLDVGSPAGASSAEARKWA